MFVMPVTDQPAIKKSVLVKVLHENLKKPSGLGIRLIEISVFRWTKMFFQHAKANDRSNCRKTSIKQTNQTYIPKVCTDISDGFMNVKQGVVRRFVLVHYIRTSLTGESFSAQDFPGDCAVTFRLKS